MRRLALIISAGLVSLGGAAAEQTAKPLKNFPEGYWRRTQLHGTPCQNKGSHYSVRIRAEDREKAKAELEDYIQTQKSFSPPDNCRQQIGYRSDRPRPLTLETWLDNGAIQGFQREILKNWTLLQWQKQTSYSGSDNLLEKWKLLTSELENNKKDLAKAPHIEAMVRGEIARLEPHTEFQRKTMGMTFILVQIEE